MGIDKIAIKAIEGYQKYLSKTINQGNGCKFTPSCSQYTKEAIEKYGTIIGSAKGTYRILRCNPFSKGGYDPVK